MITEREYNCIDTLATSRIFRAMQDDDFGRHCADFDYATLGPALTMQLRGLRVDRAGALAARGDTLVAAEELKEQFATLAGGWKWAGGLKPAPITFAKLLYDKLHVKPRMGKEGRRTVNKEALADIIEDSKTSEEAYRLVQIAQELEVMEEDRKVLSKPLRNGRMHCSYFVAGTTSGRWSSKQDHFDTGANLQALSNRLHRMFTADPGWVLVNIDQKQGESKIVSYLARCHAYRDAHLRGNVHVNVGMMIWPALITDAASCKNTPLPWDANKSYYDASKRLQHATNYGQTHIGFARHAHITEAIARDQQARYFSAFPEIRDWHIETGLRLKYYARLTTPLGRVRHFLGRTWEDNIVKEGLAYVPQSMCAQINKIALHRIWSRFDPLRAQILAEGHDSILFQVREGDSDTVNEILACLEIPVPIHDQIMYPAFEAEWGYSWDKHTMREWKGSFNDNIV